MEMNHTNHAERLPYEKLAMLGLNREQTDKLPQDVRLGLLRGDVTPLIQVSLAARNGDVITLPLKLQLVADRHGLPALIAYPARAEPERERSPQLNLSEADMQRLKKGEVIEKALEKDGAKTRRYLQLDPETKSVIHRNVADIKLEQLLRERLREMEKVNDIELGTQQKQQIREGRPVELNVGGEKVSVGIDLREPQGFRVIKGDLNEWDRQRQMRYDEAHPEFVGLVQTDKNRWEYRQVVDKRSVDRAIQMKAAKETRRSNTLKR